MHLLKCEFYKGYGPEAHILITMPCIVSSVAAIFLPPVSAVKVIESVPFRPTFCLSVCLLFYQLSQKCLTLMINKSSTL